MDLTSGLFTGRASVVTRSIGDFILDCTVREEHASSLRLTKNPIESGADIADHAILEPKTLTVTGVVVGYEPPQNFKNLTGFDTSVLDDYPLPLEISANMKQAEAMIEQYIGIANAGLDAAGKVLAPWYPDSGIGSADTSQTLDRVGRAYDSLLSLQKHGETIDVQTGIKLYKNMMITNVGTIQDKPGSAEVTLTLEEIFIVENQTAKGLHPDLKGQPQKQNMGRTQPANKVVDKNSSVITDIKNAVVSSAKDLMGVKP